MITLVSEVRELVRLHAELAILEVRRAVHDAALVTAAAVGIALLLVTAWFALVTAATGAIAGLRAGWIGALLISSGLNLVLAALLALWARSRLHRIGLPATLRQLRPAAAPAGSPAAPSPPRDPAFPHSASPTSASPTSASPDLASPGAAPVPGAASPTASPRDGSIDRATGA